MLIAKGILLFIHVVVCIVLVVVILLQASKGGGLAGIAGGQASSAIFGARGTATALTKFTQYIAAIFLILSLTLSFMAGAGGSTGSVTQKVLEQMPASQLPPVESLEFGTTPTGAGEAGSTPPGAEPETE